MQQASRTTIAAITAIVTLATVVGSGSPVGAQAGPDQGSGLSQVPAPIIVDAADGSHDHDLDVTDLPPELPALSDQAPALSAAETLTIDPVAGLTVQAAPDALLATSGMWVSYANAAPSDVKAAIQASVDAWNQTLTPVAGAPIEVRVTWESLGNTNVLGAAGPAAMYYGPQLPDPNLMYPSGLANVLLGRDVDDGSGPEIKVRLNSDLYPGEWHTGSTAPPADKIDLRSVVIHEIGHGLGFLGSAASSPTLHDPPSVYDDTVTYGGTKITNLADPAAALTSNNLRTTVSATVAATLYSPSTWTTGSSLSHFDPSGAQRNAVMAPSLGAGQRRGVPDAWVVGKLAQLGWPIAVGPINLTGSSAVGVTSNSIRVSWSYDLTNNGLAPDRVRVRAALDGQVVSSTDANAGAGSYTINGLAASTGYTVTVTPLAGGKTGTTRTMAASTPAALAMGPQPSFVRTRAGDHQVSRVFQSFFQRHPDQAGFDYWMGRRANGLPLVSIYNQFATSSEFVQRYGALSNPQFVDLVYQNVLGRPADAQGRQFWIGRLDNGMSRAAMMMGFAEGDEFVTRTGTVAPYPSTEGKIRRLYQAFFLRPPDDSGLAYWTGVANNGSDLATIAGQFAGGAEFKQRYGALTNPQFVSLVYRNVLGRDPDLEGYNFWTGRLAAGMSRGSMMVGFSESAEYIRSTGTIP